MLHYKVDLKVLRFVDKPEFCDAKRVAGSVIQDICSMKPRFRKTNFIITHAQPIPLGVTFSKAQSSKLERLFCHVSVKRDVRALSFEL